MVSTENAVGSGDHETRQRVYLSLPQSPLPDFFQRPWEQNILRTHLTSGAGTCHHLTVLKVHRLTRVRYMVGEMLVSLHPGSVMLQNRLISPHIPVCIALFLCPCRNPGPCNTGDGRNLMPVSVHLWLVFYTEGLISGSWKTGCFLSHEDWGRSRLGGRLRIEFADELRICNVYLIWWFLEGGGEISSGRSLG